MDDKTLLFLSFVQYSIALLMCLFLYRVIKIIYNDYTYANNPSIKRNSRLIVLERGFLYDDTAVFPIADLLNIGRGTNNELVIQEGIVSNEHASITLDKNGVLLSDLNSTNGILHNGKRLTQNSYLQHGDKIQIGSTIFRFEE